MTKKLEDVFEMKSITEYELEHTDDNQEAKINDVNKSMELIDWHQQESDEIRKKAIETFEDVKEVAQNVNPERSARLYEVAGQFLKTGLDATNSKLEKELKVATLKLAAAKLKLTDESYQAVVKGNEIMADRNQLLKQLKEESITVELEEDEDEES